MAWNCYRNCATCNPTPFVLSAINKAGAFRFIPKPWDDDQLLDNIREGLKFRDILLENRILAETVREQRETLRSMGYEG